MMFGQIILFPTWMSEGCQGWRSSFLRIRARRTPRGVISLARGPTSFTVGRSESDTAIRWLLGYGAGCFRLVRLFELEVFIDDLRNVFFGDLHIPKSFRPDHHVGSEGADVQTAASDHADFAFEVSFLANFSQLLDHLFRAAVAARRAFSVAVVDTDMNLPDIGLRSLNHEPPLMVSELPSFAEAHGCKPVDECEVGTLRSLGEGGYASEGSARRSVWRGATAARPWGPR